MFFVLALILLKIILLYFILKPYRYWIKRDIPYIKPWPLFGSMIQNFLGIRPFALTIQDMYNKFPNKRYIGFNLFTKPTIMLRDPELIKQIYVKHSDHFPDHPPLSSNEEDAFVNKSLISLKGNNWRRMRSILSPTFTSSKLKTMFDLTNQCCQKFVDYFEIRNGDYHANMKDVFTRFVNDVAVNLAFGINCDSMNDKNNRIYNIGKKTLGNFTPLKFFGYAINPTLMRFLNVNFFDIPLQNTFNDIIKQSMKIRKMQGIIRPDMLHLLMEAQKSNEIGQKCELENDSNYNLTDEDIIAQAILFYGAAYDTASNFMVTLAYELALNMGVQNKLRKEIDHVLKECDGSITYERLFALKYLDMVVSEGLRLWPVTTFSDRVCTKPYIIQPSEFHQKPVTLDVGTYIWIPLYALHRDPKYFPNPNKFDPERFSRENKNKIIPFTYMPFGGGPRQCIALRFALLEVKLIFFHIISKFEIVPVQDTMTPFKLSKTNINLVNEGDVILGFKPRSLS